MICHMLKCKPIMSSPSNFADDLQTVHPRVSPIKLMISQHVEIAKNYKAGETQPQRSIRWRIATLGEPTSKSSNTIQLRYHVTTSCSMPEGLRGESGDTLWREFRTTGELARSGIEGALLLDLWAFLEEPWDCL